MAATIGVLLANHLGADLSCVVMEGDSVTALSWTLAGKARGGNCYERLGGVDGASSVFGGTYCGGSSAQLRG